MNVVHDYLRAIGFSEVKRNKEYRKIIQEVLEEPTEIFMSPFSAESPFGGMAKEYADAMGLLVYGEMDENADLDVDYAFPYLKGRTVSCSEYVTVEKIADKDSYLGIFDTAGSDMGFGVSVIFQILNIKDYKEFCMKKEKLSGKVPIRLSALSISGKVILPIQVEHQEREMIEARKEERKQLVASAKQGDIEAIENLTFDDITQYTTAYYRAKSEDVLSIVESSLIPYGVTYDHYFIIGAILSVDELTNSATGEIVYRMSIECNDLIFDLCINQKDLFGEPDIGRRFRGNIWLQGTVDFEQGVENTQKVE